MHIAPTSQPATPPARWNHFWQTPLARFDYEPTGRIAADAIWREGWLPASRTITGDRSLDLRFAGTSRDEAVRAARLLTSGSTTFEVDAADGAKTLLEVNPAVAILEDREAGTFWLAPIEASVLAGGEWTGGAHTVDGAAFEGPKAALASVQVRSALDELVAVVGRDVVVTPTPWDKPEA